MSRNAFVVDLFGFEFCDEVNSCPASYINEILCYNYNTLINLIKAYFLSGVGPAPNAPDKDKMTSGLTSTSDSEQEEDRLLPLAKSASSSSSSPLLLLLRPLGASESLSSASSRLFQSTMLVSDFDGVDGLLLRLVFLRFLRLRLVELE